VHQKQPVANVAVSIFSTSFISDADIVLYFFSELQATMAQKLNKVMKALLIINMVEDKFQSENRQGKAKKKVLTSDYRNLLQIFNKPGLLTLL
jgi:hypothetical protein